MPAPCPDDNLLARLISGELDAARSRQVRAHLDDCSDCAALFRELASLLPPLEGTPEERVGESVEIDEIGRFKIIERIGAGTMGVVYRGWDPELEREVAIKLLRHDAARWHDSPAQGSARLLREARALARLDHPHLVTVYDVGELAGRVYMVSALVQGPTARVWCVGKPWPEIVRLYVQAARALEAAHGSGIVHRDVKPENLLVNARDQAMVTDFGLATAPVPPDEYTYSRGEEEELLLTTSGALVGTPAYMSPEQLDGQPATPLSDQYSLCVALHEALYGFRPYGGRTLEELACQARQGALSAPRSSSLPSRLFRVLARGLSPRPSDRYPSMGALIEALERAARPRPMFGMGAGGASLVVALVVVWGVGTMASEGAPHGRAPEVIAAPDVLPPFLSEVARLEANRWVALALRAAELEVRLATPDRGERSSSTPLQTPPSLQPPSLPKTPFEHLKQACAMVGAQCERGGEACLSAARDHLRAFGPPKKPTTTESDARVVLGMYASAARCAYVRGACDEVWTFVQAAGYSGKIEHDVVTMAHHHPRCASPSHELELYALHTAMVMDEVRRREDPHECVALMHRIERLDDLWNALQDGSKDAQLLSGHLDEVAKCVGPLDCDQARALWLRAYKLRTGEAYVERYRAELEQSFSCSGGR